MICVNEDTNTTCKTANPLGAWLNAKERGEVAMNLHREFFESDEHLDRLEAVAQIIKDFFGHSPNYYTPRGIGRKPFESVKVSDCGWFLSRKSVQEKSERLYEPLDALGDVDFKSKNGHLIVRVFPKSKQP
jgi:hypothetical protein